MKKGFALIYILLFITLLLTAASATWITGMADLRLSQRSSNSVQASELAKSAIDAGFVKYKTDISTNLLRDDTYPTSSQVYRIYLSGTAPAPINLSSIPSLTETTQGVYDYRIFTPSGVTTIEGIGYYKGSKITLKAVVNHDADTTIMGPNLGDPQIGWNHPNDYLTTYQTGPSQ